MVIYIDLFIIVNFIIDLLLLISVDIVLKRRGKWLRLILSSLFASFSVLVLLFINGIWFVNLYKFIISIVMILIAFGYNNFKYFKDNIFWLYIISIVLGGTLYFIDDSINYSNNYLVFIKNKDTINVIIIFLLAFILIKYYIFSLKTIKDINHNYYDLNIYYNDICIKSIGYLDTGNNLIDPYFKYPIILVNKELIKEHPKTFLVPFDSLNSHGLLKCFKPKSVIINGKKIRRVIIGLSDINYNGVKIILNKEII